MSLIDEFVNMRRWAVVGASPDQSKFGNRILRDLRDAGYQVIPVNPYHQEVEGETCYPSVSLIPDKPQVVDVVVPPHLAQGVLEDCLTAGVTRVWFQPGAENEAAIHWGQSQGLQIVWDACAMVEKRRWL